MKSLRMAIALALFVGLGQAAAAQEPSDPKELRRAAMELFKQSKAVEAKPLFEKLVEAFPDDFDIVDSYSMVLLTHAATLPDSDARKKARILARQMGERARDLGKGKSGYWEVALRVPEDGSESAFSSNAEIERIMKEAEADFAKGELEKAFDGYLRALAIEPKLYWAALFCGDVRYKQGRHEEAWPWFARAIEIDPRTETAYRYWADSLLKAGRLQEARSKAIDAVIADPYTRWTWNALMSWAGRAGVQLSHPRIESPNSLKKDSDSKTTINIDPSALDAKDGRDMWIIYEMSRAAWTAKDSDSFRKAYPDEKSYRHSLEEERGALGLVASTVDARMKKGEIKSLHPSLQPLLKLHQDGLLEAYILLARADEGIAKDYAAYKEKNAAKLRKYLEEWVAPLPAPNN